MKNEYLYFMPLTTRLMLIATLLPLLSQAQQSDLLSPSQAATIITDSIKKEFKLTYPVFRVYHYTDKSGQYYCILTESDDSIVDNANGGKDTISHALRAVDLKADQGKMTKMWEINDHILKSNYETTIRFWTRFSEFKDYDGDGLIEPLIIYGTLGMNGRDDGRVKFIMYWKGRKFALRNQNSTFDGEGSTEYDADMPKVLDDAFQKKREQIDKELGMKI